MKHILLVVVALSLVCCKYDKRSKYDKVAEMSNTLGRGEALIDISNKLRTNYDAYLAEGYKFIAKQQMDSAMFYGGKIKATDEALDAIHKLLTDLKLKVEK